MIFLDQRSKFTIDNPSALPQIIVKFSEYWVVNSRESKESLG